MSVEGAIDTTVFMLRTGDHQVYPFTNDMVFRRFDLVRLATIEERKDAHLPTDQPAVWVQYTGLDGYPDGYGAWPANDPITVVRGELVISEEEEPVSARELLARDHVAHSASAANFLAGYEAFPEIPSRDATRATRDESSTSRDA